MYDKKVHRTQASAIARGEVILCLLPRSGGRQNKRMPKDKTERRHRATMLAGKHMIRIDKNVRKLVLKLNRVSGVFTSSSCGGHDNPKGSRQPRGCFFVIMVISNSRFLDYVKFLCEDLAVLCSFEYNDIHETWCIHGDDRIIPLLESAIDIYITQSSDCKPVSEWDKFYSYGERPVTIAQL